MIRSKSLRLRDRKGGHYRCPNCNRHFEAFVTVLRATCGCGYIMTKDKAAIGEKAA